ncbi:heme-copper oxidase subunit III [Actinospica durhamensis]|uniref:cytochrome-c oxidase n=1 Tax=Actinospica durhamensis TaxID=1508375 RepID=A0A941EJ43_9ACTN|nr:heme-copper oxidase subunit III [Actinospica durhamensis]MBR7832161.1 heme-copper oxidase subunit III [Actinospica durhamensis]
MAAVATATATQAAPAHRVPNRPNLVSVGTIIWLASELMFFAALFAIYFTLRSVSGNSFFEQNASNLNVKLSSVNTIILVASSFPCQFGVFAAERHQVKRTGSLLNLRRWGMREWYMWAFILGAIFISLQVYEYSSLVRDGHPISENQWTSAFYLATGFHGLHVTGGLFAFLMVLMRTYKAKRFTHDQEISAIVVSYYWHFVDVVWIGLFFVIYILK